MSATPDQREWLEDTRGPISRELRGIRLLLEAMFFSMPWDKSAANALAADVLARYRTEGYDETEEKKP